MTKIDPAIKNKGRKSVKDTKKTGFLGSTKMNRAIKKKRWKGAEDEIRPHERRFCFVFFFRVRSQRRKLNQRRAEPTDEQRGGGRRERKRFLKVVDDERGRRRRRRRRDWWSARRFICGRRRCAPSSVSRKSRPARAERRAAPFGRRKQIKNRKKSQKRRRIQ